MNGNGFYGSEEDEDLAPSHNLSQFVNLIESSSFGRNDDNCKIDTNYVFSIYGFKIGG